MSLIEIEDAIIYKCFFSPNVRWTDKLENRVENHPKALDMFLRIKGISDVIGQTYNKAEWRICADKFELAGGGMDRTIGFDLKVGDANKSLSLRYVSYIRSNPKLSFKPGSTGLYISDNENRYCYNNNQSIASCAFKDGRIVFNLRKNDKQEKIKQILISPVNSTLRIDLYEHESPKDIINDTQPELTFL